MIQLDDDDLGLLRLFPGHEDYEPYGGPSQTVRHWPEMWAVEWAASAAVWAEQEAARERWLASDHHTSPSCMLQRQALEQLCNESGWQVAATLPDGREIYMIR